MWNIILEKLVQNSIPEQAINAIKQKFFNRQFDFDDIKNIKYPHYEVNFINKDESEIQHTLLQGITKNNAFGGLQTSFSTAQKNNFYDKQSLIYKYAGTKKESTLLQQDMSQIKIISEKKIESITNIIVGARINGYNESLLAPELNNTIKQLNIFEEEIIKILLELDCPAINLSIINDIIKISVLSIL